MARKKKSNGRAAYFICLSVYILLLIVASCVGLSVVWQYAKEYENSRPLNVVGTMLPIFVRTCGTIILPIPLPICPMSSRVMRSAPSM